MSLSREAWATRYGLRESRGGHRCLTWLEKGRCRQYCPPPLGKVEWDHPSAWIDKGGQPALILLQNYDWPMGYLDLRELLDSRPQLYMHLERPENGWHSDRASLIEIWRNEDAYLAAIGSK